MKDNANTAFSWPLVGNRQVAKYLEKSIINNRIAGAYIFHGPDDLGKTTLARHFAQILMCCRQGAILPCKECPACKRFKSGPDTDGEAHSDLYILKKEKDKQFIPVEETREFIRRLSMSSFLNSYKIGIIKGAENLNQASANALLKTLEEPKKDVIIILSVHDLALLPATIVSRAQILNFYPVKADAIYDYLIREFDQKRSEAKKLSRLCLGRPALAAKFAQDKEFLENYEKNVNVFLNFKGNNLNSRFAAIEEMIDPKEKGREAVKTAGKALWAWRGILRDILLASYNFNDILQHQADIEKISLIRSKLSVREILSLYKAITEAEEDLAANVNPKLALEGVAVKFGN